MDVPILAGNGEGTMNTLWRVQRVHQILRLTPRIDYSPSPWLKGML